MPGCSSPSATRPCCSGSSGYPSATRVRSSAPAWPEEVVAACPWGVFVARRAGPEGDLARPWVLSVLTAIQLLHLMERHGYVPLVATVAGFVTTGAEILDVLPAPSSSRTRPCRALTLREPGPWFETFRDRRLPTGPGAAWVLLNMGQSGT